MFNNYCYKIIYNRMNLKSTHNPQYEDSISQPLKVKGGGEEEVENDRHIHYITITIRREKETHNTNRPKYP